jgi:hypothetical protein
VAFWPRSGSFSLLSGEWPTLPTYAFFSDSIPPLSLVKRISVFSRSRLFERGHELADLGIELRHHRGHTEPRVVFLGVVVELDAVVQPLVLVRRIDGRVHRMKGNIDQPGSLLFLDSAQGFGRDQLGGVPSRARASRRDAVSYGRAMLARQGSLRGQRAVAVVEAELVRPHSTTLDTLPA